MRTSDKGIGFIKGFEGLRLVAFKATPTEKYFTIGYGRYGKSVGAKMRITAFEAEQMLRDDLAPVETCLNYGIFIPLSQPQFDALASLIFNVGVARWTESTARHCLNDRDLFEFCRQAFSPEIGFVRQNGKVLNGLVCRREAEQLLFQHGLYQQQAMA
ncbi:lysozyme [Roseicella sp. DB1501]|uniref:lysozyme n=1 Tax=Roseicella sp. DB1501 TaxID=2730925 RepID=UPI0014924CFF|nr:lysozyme [Roseicella sp. DB1501]